MNVPHRLTRATSIASEERVGVVVEIAIRRAYMSDLVLPTL
jgi:hypothetical protein